MKKTYGAYNITVFHETKVTLFLFTSGSCMALHTAPKTLPDRPADKNVYTANRLSFRKIHIKSQSLKDLKRRH